MGGTACIIIIQAIVRYKAVPNAPSKQRELESQLRVCYANSTIAEEVAKDEAKAEHLWDILEKEHLTLEDLDELLHGLPQYTEDA